MPCEATVTRITGLIYSFLRLMASDAIAFPITSPFFCHDRNEYGMFHYFIEVVDTELIE